MSDNIFQFPTSIRSKNEAIETIRVKLIEGGYSAAEVNSAFIELADIVRQMEESTSFTLAINTPSHLAEDSGHAECIAQIVEGVEVAAKSYGVLTAKLFSLVVIQRIHHRRNEPVGNK